jgi:hypothetical protein
MKIKIGKEHNLIWKIIIIMYKVIIIIKGLLVN